MDKMPRGKAPRVAGPGQPAAPQPPDDAVAFAGYVAALTEELSRLARTNGLTTLAYLLDMARLEARNVALVDGPPGKAGPPDGM